MNRGCDVHSLLNNLATKGFQASKHPLLMHRVMCHQSFQRMRDKFPDLYPDVDHMNLNASSGNPACLPEEWQQWIDECLRDGIDGLAVVETLRAEGVELGRAMLRNDDGTRLGDKQLLQSLMRNEGGAITDPITPVLRDFFIASATGSINDVKLYISAGQNCDALDPDRSKSSSRTALGLAAMNGHVDVCEYIIDEGHCNIDQRDNTGRTALHHAAKAQQQQTLQLILDKGANMHLTDNYGNTPFHTAARYGSSECCEVLTGHEEENLRQVLSGKVIVSKDGKELMGRPEAGVEGVASTLFHEMIAEKMKRSEAQRFLKDWCYEAAERVYGMVKESEHKMIGPPTRNIVDHALDRFDPDPDAGYWVGKKGNQRWVKVIDEPKHLIQILQYTFKHCFVDARNTLKRTALHEACFENRCASHADAVKVIVDLHRSNTWAFDMHERTPYDLLITEKARLGEPSGSSLRESVITERRKDLVESLRAEEIKKEKEETERRLSALLESCCKRGTELDTDSWGMMREISEQLRIYEDWIEFEDGDTNNFFYAKKVQTEEELMAAAMVSTKSDGQGGEGKDAEAKDEKKRLEEDEEERKKMRAKRLAMKAPVMQEEKDEAAAATWERPAPFNLRAKVQQAWSCVLQYSTFERKHGAWDVMADKRSGECFYKNGETEDCQWDKPFVATWEGLMQNSTVQEELGLHNEWERRTDSDGNEFYVRSSEKLLSALNSTKRFVNLYFPHRVIDAEAVANTKVVLHTPDQTPTNRLKDEKNALDNSPGDEALSEMTPEEREEWLKPIYRWTRPPEALHKMKTKEKMDKMRKKHKLSFLEKLKKEKEDEDIAHDIQIKRDSKNPVQLAFVPLKWPDGTFKLRQGWALCRKVASRPPIKGWQLVIDPEVPR